MMNYLSVQPLDLALHSQSSRMVEVSQSKDPDTLPTVSNVTAGSKDSENPGPTVSETHGATQRCPVVQSQLVTKLGCWIFLMEREEL